MDDGGQVRRDPKYALWGHPRPLANSKAESRSQAGYHTPINRPWRPRSIGGRGRILGLLPLTQVSQGSGESKALTVEEAQGPFNAFLRTALPAYFPESRIFSNYDMSISVAGMQGCNVFRVSTAFQNGFLIICLIYWVIPAASQTPLISMAQ